MEDLEELIMAALSDSQILDLIHDQQLQIEPLIADNVQPASVDLTLHQTISVLKQERGPIDSKNIKTSNNTLFEELQIPGEGFVLNPMSYVVGHSAELVVLPQSVNGAILNRNSLAQIGIDVTSSAYINPGFSGRKTIVIHNFGSRSIILYAGMRICQLVLFTLGTASLRSYNDRHQESRIIDYARSCVGSDVLIEGENHHLDNSLSRILDNMLQKARQD